MDASIKAARLAKLLVITLLSIVLIPLVVLAVYVEWPLGDAIFWHLRNGSTVSVEGHAVRVPLQFQVETYKGGYELTKSHGFFGGLASVAIEPAGKVLDAQAIEEWRSSLLPLLNSRGGSEVPSSLRGKKLNLMCLQSKASDTDESLICRAVDSNLAVHTEAVGKANVAEVRSVLEASD